MKYIDADKLIALIDAKLEDLGLSGSVWVGRSVLQDLKNAIIASLQQEQPEVDLDNHTIMEEIRKCGCNPNEFDVARHFYELGLNVRKEE